MLPWVQLDTAAVPGADGGLRLMRRGSEYSIMSGSIELMNSRISGSEEALAKLTCGRICERQRSRVLIGGLGMGFTLRAALPILGPDAHIDIAELVPEVVAWAHGPLADVFGESLQDPRVQVHERDVAHLIDDSNAGDYDAILLDVDNGPDGLTREANDSLYSTPGLRAVQRALRADGVLAVWSAEKSPAFSRRLRSTGYSVDEVKVRARGSRGARHVIWVATNA